MGSSAAHASPTGFDRLYGLELVEVGRNHVLGKVAVRDELKQQLGIVHGGVYGAIAESLASIATALAVEPHGELVAPLSNKTSFLRPVSVGTIHARADAKHRGRTTWVWEVEMSDDDGALCALSRMTVAVRARGAA